MKFTIIAIIKTDQSLLPKIEKTYQDGLPLDFCTLEYQQMPEYPFRKK